MSDGIPFTTSREELECLALIHATTVTRDESNPTWRRGMLFSFTECRHTACTIVEVENARGKWGVEICNDCGQQVAHLCAHEKSEWMADGQVLLCLNCGSDGT